MSTGLTFGTISALCGLTQNIVTRERYSFLVAAVIASAVGPTMIATLAFVPENLVSKVSMLDEEERISRIAGAAPLVPEGNGSGG